MDIDGYKVFADRCFRDTPPPCAAVCPLAYDVRAFIKLMQRGSYRSAYRLYRDSVIFPSIVSRLCPGPCSAACVRGKDPEDTSVDLKGLEQRCVEHMAGKKPERYAIPKKEQRVAVIGAGLSGLACAYRLASYGYQVTVYERTAFLGGTVGEQTDPAWCHSELEREFSAVEWDFVPDLPVRRLSDIPGDAFYVATGAGGDPFATEKRGVFRGGGLCGASFLDSIAHGLAAAAAIEVFFKTGAIDRESMQTVQRAPDERYYHIHYDRAIKIPASKKGEAEAYRCMRCSCSECYDVCPLMEKERYFPRKMCGEITLTLKPNMSKRTGVRMIMGCTDCKKCRDVCPEHIDMGQCLEHARTDLYESGAMAPAFHDYWLQDMDFCLSDEAYLVWRPRGDRPSDVVFFPGCQLGASWPAYVKAAYEAVERGSENGAVFLGCCGVPARWAGRPKEAKAVARRIRDGWERLGRPKFLTGCPTCLAQLKSAVPQIQAQSIYTWLEEHPGVIPADGVPRPDPVRVLDPCASADAPGMQKSVRRLLQDAGYTVENGEVDIGCCGFGGHIYNAVPELYHTFAKRRVEGKEGILATYCANCRDVFAAKGADARHVLGLLLGLEEAERRPPELDARRENRRALKRYFTGEEAVMMNDRLSIQIPMALIHKMDQELILREQVDETIRWAEENGEKIVDEEDAMCYAHRRFGSMTLWTAYQRDGDRVDVANVYAHRVEIREGL